MTKRTGPTNPVSKDLIRDTKVEAKEKESKLWRRIASDLEKPTRIRRIVNISKINRFTNENETVIVPGKVLGSGDIEHKITIAAFKFSESARKKLEDSGSKLKPLNEIIKEDPKGKSIRIIG